MTSFKILFESGIAPLVCTKALFKPLALAKPRSGLAR